MTIPKWLEEKRFRKIPSFPQYYINEQGTIYSTLSEQFLKPVLSPRGYYRTNLKQRSFGLSRLVLTTWNRRPKFGEQAAHLNGDRKDNRIENLKWVTARENEWHKELHGTKLLGAKTVNAKLTADKVREIRRKYKVYGYKKTNSHALAAEYGVHYTNINLIVTRKTWSHI